MLPLLTFIILNNTVKDFSVIPLLWWSAEGHRIVQQYLSWDYGHWNTKMEISCSRGKRMTRWQFRVLPVFPCRNALHHFAVRSSHLNWNIHGLKTGSWKISGCYLLNYYPLFSLGNYSTNEEWSIIDVVLLYLIWKFQARNSLLSLKLMFIFLITQIFHICRVLKLVQATSTKHPYVIS